MPDMNAEFYRCCGYTVEISEHVVETADGKRGRQVHCAMCNQAFLVPGDVQAAKKAVPDHFLAVHKLKGTLDDWSP